MTRAAGAPAVPRTPELPGAGVVHVWWTRAGAASPTERQVLSADERAREALLRRPEDRECYVTGALMVRRLAAAATGLALAEAPVARRCRHCDGAHGPPRIPGYEVSVSHSGRWVVVACAAGGLVGVDTEVTGRDLTGVAAEFLAPHERCPGDDLVRRWTRKEAVLKATGQGLSVDPSVVVVDETAAGPLVVEFPGGPEVDQWFLTGLTSPAGMVASLATWGERPRVQQWPSSFDWTR